MTVTENIMGLQQTKQSSIYDCSSTLGSTINSKRSPQYGQQVICDRVLSCIFCKNSLNRLNNQQCIVRAR